MQFAREGGLVGPGSVDKARLGLSQALLPLPGFQGLARLPQMLLGQLLGPMGTEGVQARDEDEYQAQQGGHQGQVAQGGNETPPDPTGGSIVQPGKVGANGLDGVDG